jgi:hypothetical protein
MAVQRKRNTPRLSNFSEETLGFEKITEKTTPEPEPEPEVVEKTEPEPVLIVAPTQVPNPVPAQPSPPVIKTEPRRRNIPRFTR